MQDLVYEVGIQGVKLKTYLLEEIKLSSRFIKASAAGIKVNGRNKKMDYLLNKGDVITIPVNIKEQQNILPEKMDLDIVYEDDDVLVLNKPPFVLVFPTPNHENHTLANGVLWHFKERGDKTIVRLVNRLDRDTSGLVVIAKNSFSHMQLAKAMEESKIEKYYLAVVHGHISPPSGTIDLPIGKSEKDPIRRCVCENGQRSITHYETVKAMEKGSFLQLQLETGRTHQIRVHLSHLGHSIYGDTLYGDADKIISRQALHASRISFPHPRTGEIINLTSQLPKDMEILIEYLTEN